MVPPVLQRCPHHAHCLYHTQLTTHTLLLVPAANHFRIPVHVIHRPPAHALPCMQFYMFNQEETSRPRPAQGEHVHVHGYSHLHQMVGRLGQQQQADEQDDGGPPAIASDTRYPFVCMSWVPLHNTTTHRGLRLNCRAGAGHVCAGLVLVRVW